MDLGGVLVFVDHLHRQETLARIGQGDRHRTRVEIEHRRRIERVAVHPDDGLLGDRRRFAAMHEFAETPVLDHAAEIEIRLGADEIVGGDGDRLIVGRRVGDAIAYSASVANSVFATRRLVVPLIAVLQVSTCPLKRARRTRAR